MERQVAQAVNRFLEDDIDIFGATDRPALMSLVEEFFCGEDPEDIDSG